MTTGLLPFEVKPSALVPPSLQPFIRPLEPALLRHFLPHALCSGYSASNPSHASAKSFASDMLRHLDIGYRITAADLARIPASGPCIVTANHPFGLLEGFILLSILERIRTDYRIVANHLLASTPALHQRVIFVDPFEDADPYKNGKALRASLACLRAGGLLVMFPAGEVSHFIWQQRAIAEPEWNPSAARLARKVGCPALPFFFNGSNSLPFQLLGAINPRLRTLNLARELVNKKKRVIEVRVGTQISTQVLKSYPDAEAATLYLRARTLLLGSRSATVKPVAKPRCAMPPGGVSPACSAEMEALPESRVLISNEEFKVVVAAADEIPKTLRDIGRARELAYREVGEGTGNDFDLDNFDKYYQHMVLWSNRDRRVAGAYRLATTPAVLRERGIGGLYTSTLFHYLPEFFRQMGPAIELGRSFICREYQKHYMPLLLLWKGIAKYALQHPDCPVLFGAVSISGDYAGLSQTLIVNFLSGLSDVGMSSLVKPRRRFRSLKFVPKPVHQLTQLLPSLDELSSSVQDLERDGKGLPVLIRQYCKLGGKLAAFNVDTRFSNAIDALVIADLRTASPAMLERCMGRVGAAEFRAFQAGAQPV